MSDHNQESSFCLGINEDAKFVLPFLSITIGAFKMFDVKKSCFVIMPFGKRVVGESSILARFIGLRGPEVDFDHIYKNIFEPAISAVTLPEGGKLIPKRADQTFLTGVISHDMFIDIEYSRFVVADLTGLNANVFYELGMRHRARSTGTALFRQVGQPIPFDVQQTRAFPYAYNPQEEAQKSRELITRVVTESLVHSPLDSPIWQVLQQQRAGGLAEESLRLAEEALRARDLPNAERRLIAAAAADPSNVLTHMKLGLLYRDLGEWENARDSFDQVLRMLPNYPEALREKGIAENKIHGKTKVGPDGEASLRAALAKAPHDFDAAASLGGILKRRGDYAGAAGQYELATDLSRGHPYPLLNMIACRARRDGRLDLAPFQTSIEHAEAVLRPQVESGYDSPWSFFDLAEICLLTNREAEGIALIRQAQMQPGTVGWQLKTFRETLQLIAEVSDLDSLNNAIAVLPQED